MRTTLPRFAVKTSSSGAAHNDADPSRAPPGRRADADLDVAPESRQHPDQPLGGESVEVTAADERDLGLLLADHRAGHHLAQALLGDYAEDLLGEGFLGDGLAGEGPFGSACGAGRAGLTAAGFCHGALAERFAGSSRLMVVRSGGSLKRVRCPPYRDSDR